MVDMRQVVVLMIIMHQSNQSFSSNKKRRINDVASNCSTRFFQPSKQIASIYIITYKNILLSAFALENYSLSFYGA